MNTVSKMFQKLFLCKFGRPGSASDRGKRFNSSEYRPEDLQHSDSNGRTVISTVHSNLGLIEVANCTLVVHYCTPILKGPQS